VRRLRSEASRSERLLWSRLRNEQLGVRFRRQWPIGKYTLDFFAPKINLAIEVDGEQHDPERDSVRDAFLHKKGIDVIRIPSKELFDEQKLRGWIDYLWQEIQRRQSPP
jgi:BirA family biotin operon repressor/biotin-[acetyl-CoA-carboxylase] ligase